MDIATALETARSSLNSGAPSDLVACLAPFQNQYPFERNRDRSRFNRLLALGLLEANRLDEAESVVERSLADDGPSVDIWYLSARLALAMREYERAVAAARHYLDLMDNQEAGFSATLTRYSEMYNVLGRAQVELHRSDEAIDSFERAVVLDCESQSPYLNLANLLAHRDRRTEAFEVIDRGIENCRQVQELQLLKTALTERPSVSACMIVKDEQALLPGCLDSIRDWVSEIIVVDTGSTDRTIEIAREYGAKVFHQAWENDFSKHRNYSIEQATGDWVFIIDADERFVIEDLPLVFDVMNAGQYGMLSIGVYNEYAREKDQITFVNSVRFFKRELNLRYRGIVHNELQLAEGRPVLRTPARMRHLGYGLSSEQMEQKFQRTRQLLQCQLDEDPDNAFALFNYAQLLRGAPNANSRENATEVIETAERVIELIDADNPGQQHLHLMSLNHLAAAHLSLKDYERAGEYCRAALGLRSDYLDALIHLAYAYHGLKDYGAAIEQFEAYLEAQRDFDGAKETMPIILTYPQARDLAYTHLGILYELTDDPDHARQCYLKALADNPDYRETAAWLGRLCLAEGDLENAEKYFRHQLNHAGPTPDTLLGLASIYQDRGHEADARQMFEAAAESFPDKPNVLLRYGRYLLDRERITEAGDAFDRALVLDDGQNQYEIAVAEAYFERGRYETAANYYRQALDLYEPASEWLNDLGNCHYKLEQYPEAETYYLRAADCNPVAPLVFRNLGVTRVRLNRPRGAAEALDRYLEISPDETEIRQLAADQYREMGEFEAAIGHYEDILVGRPDNLAALYGLSESYLMMGQRDAALIGFRRLSQLAPDEEIFLNRVRQLADQIGQV